MAAYTFDEVLSAFQNAKTNNPRRWGGADVYEFARQASQVDPNFSPVAQSNWIQKGSRAIDQALAETGAPEASGNIIGQLAGAFNPAWQKTATEVGRTLPRQVVNVAPLALGPWGIPATMALSGADVYTQTGSPTAGVVGATLGLAAPLAGMRAGGQLALGQLAKAGARVGVSEAGEMVPASVLQRIAEFTGRQAGAYVGGEAAGEATSIAAGHGLYDPTSPESVISNLVGTLPFTGLDVRDYVKEVQPKIARYSTDKQIDVERPASEVPEFTPKGTPKNDEVVTQLISKTARVAEINKLEKTPELEAEKSAALKTITELANTRTPIPSNDVATGILAPDLVLDTQPDLFDPENIARIQKANQEGNKNDATSVISSLKTANNELGDVTEAQLSLNLEARAAAGATPVQAVNKSVQEVSNRAVDKVEVKSALRGSAKRVVENRAKRQEEFNAGVTAAAPEVQQVVANALAKVQPLVKGDPAKADMRFQGVVLKWMAEGSGDVGKLENGLKSALSFAQRPVPKESKVQGEVFTERINAKVAADDLNKANPEQNVRYGVKNLGKGKYQVVQEVFEKTEPLVEGATAGPEEVPLPSQEEKPINTQADFDEDNFVQDLLGAAHESDEGDAPNSLLASAIETKIDDSVRAMGDLSDNEIQALGLVDIDVPTWRKAFEFLGPMLKKGKINTAELQKAFDEGGIELDAMEFLTEPATVEMFAHAAKKLYGDQVTVARGDDGRVYVTQRTHTVQGQKGQMLKQPHVQEVIKTALRGANRVVDAFRGTGILSRFAQHLGFKGPIIENEFDPMMARNLERIKSDPEFLVEVDKLGNQVADDIQNAKTILTSYPNRDVASMVWMQNPLMGDIKPSNFGRVDFNKPAKLRGIKERLGKIELGDIISQDGWKTLSEAQPNDLVFMDPPYIGPRASYPGKQYVSAEERVRQIKEVVQPAVDRGVKIIYFDVDSPATRSALADAGLTVHSVERGGKAKPEVMATNAVEFAVGNDGVLRFHDPSAPITKIPSLMVQTRNLLDLWFSKAGFRPDETRALTEFGMKIAGLASGLDDVNLGVIKTQLQSLSGLSDNDNARIWLKNIGDDPIRLHAVLAHELGHQIDQAHFQGQVPVEWKQRYDNASRFLRDLSPDDRITVMGILKESMPKQFQHDFLIDTMLVKASESPDEAVAQATSMVMLGAVGKNRFWRSAVEMLPKPLADWVFHVLDVAKAVMDATSANAWFKLSDFNRSKEFRTSLTEFRRTLDSMWKTQKDLDAQVARLMSLEQLTPEGVDYTAQMLANPLEVNTLDDANLKPSAATAGSWMFGRYSPQVEDWYVDKGYLAKGAMKNFIQNFAPVRNLKEWYPKASKLFGIPLVQQRRREQVAEQVFTPFNLKWSEKGSSAVDDKGEVLNKVINSERLQKVISDIRRDMNLLGPKYDDKKLSAKLGTLTSSDRETVYSYVKSMTLAEESMRQTKRDSRVANIQKVAATFILKGNPTVGAEGALHAAKQIWDAIESGDPTLMAAASAMVGSSSFLDSYKFYQNLKNALGKFDSIEKANPFYTTEKRLGRYFINYVRKDGTTDTIAFDDAGAWTRAQDRLNKDLTIDKFETVDSDELNTRHGIKQELIDAADQYDQQVADNIRGLLSAADFDTIRPYLSVKNELLKEFAAASPALMAGLPGDVTKELRREFKGERKGLNLVRNQLINLNARVSELARADARSDMMLNMSDPEQTYNRRQDIVSLIHKNYENYQMPDTQLGSLTNLGAFTYFLGGNMSNMVMEGAQWMVTLPSILTEIGAQNHGGKGIGVVESWSRTLAAAKEVAGWYQKGKKWKDPEVADLMEQASYEIDRTTGTMEDVISKESMALINSARMGKGLMPITLGTAIGNPLTHYMSFMRKMYQIPSGLNNRIALVAGYKLARERGLGHQAAVEDAKRVSYLANFNEGKAGRPIAPFSNKGAIGRTAAQMMFSLQAYNMGIISTFARQAMTAFSKRTDLTLAQRRSARRALLQLGTTQFAIAGTLGMPFVGAGLAVLNQLFPDLNAEEDLRKTVALLGGHDRELGGLISRFATDGVLNQVLPIDIASRYGIGNIAGLSSYDGWKMENFFGPVGSMLSAGFKGASNLVQGNMGQAFEDVVPIGFKNLTKMYRDDWKIMDNEGRLLLEPSQSEVYMKAIGFAPTRLAASQRAGRLEARSKSIESRRRKLFRTEMADLFDSGQVGKAQQILQQKSLDDPTFDRNYEIRQITEMLLRRQIPQSNGTSSETQQHLLGVPPEVPTQSLQRHQLGSQIQVGLGGHPRKDYQAPDLQSPTTPDESLSFLQMFQ